MLLACVSMLDGMLPNKEAECRNAVLRHHLMGTGLPTLDSLHTSRRTAPSCYVYSCSVHIVIHLDHVWSKDFPPVPPLGQVMCEVSEWYHASLAQVSGQVKLCSQKPEFPKISNVLQFMVASL